MLQVQLSGEEIGKRGKALYEKHIRQQVETETNIGKMVVIDIETGDYEVNELGIESSWRLHAKHPDAPLYGIRIGYNVAETLGGVMERTETWYTEQSLYGKVQNGWFAFWQWPSVPCLALLS